MGEALDFALFLLPLLALAWITARAVSDRSRAAPALDTDVVGRRVVAHLLDWVLIGLCWISVIPTSYHLGRWLGWTASTRLVFDNAFATYGFVGVTLADLIVLQALTGYTVGKRVLGIRTVGEDLRSPGLKATLLRSLPLIVEQLGVVALWAMARSPRHQRFGDRWAHTYVVRDRARKCDQPRREAESPLEADDPRAVWTGRH